MKCKDGKSVARKSHDFRRPKVFAYFFERIKRDKETKCWNWVGALGATKYGTATIDRQAISAHRLSYLLFNGNLEPTLDIDHLCKNIVCVNPEHIRQTSRKENNLNSTSPSRAHALKTHCAKGHEYSLENTYRNPTNGSRGCRICRKNVAIRNWQNNREARNKRSRELYAIKRKSRD